MQEKREDIRINDSCKLSYKVRNINYGQGFTRTENISRGGFCFPVRCRIFKGETVDIEINLPKNNFLLKLSAEVVWEKERADASYPFLAGLKIIKISEKDAEILKSYIRNEEKSLKEQDVRWID